MSVISNTILTYYRYNLDQLNSEQKFHFASRIYLWNQDPYFTKELKLLRPWYTNDNNVHKTLSKTLSETSDRVYGSKNVVQLRMPYFDKYPKLGAYTAVLFKTLFLQTIYGTNCREEAAELLGKEQMDQLASNLLEDKPAMAMLSTHAVNYLYLYFNLIKDKESLLPVKQILDSYVDYDFFDRLQIQLYLYLNTHCIIADSLYYSRKLPSSNTEIYSQVIHSLEETINIYYQNINLDNKLEFLVCCRLLNLKSATEARIIDEAERSMSDRGSYIVDKLNNNPQSNNADIGRSEHRNALFIMCQTPFSPHRKQISG